MTSDFLRFYPAYTLATMKKLTKRQFNALLKQAHKRPWGYSVMVEPKGRH